jgi:hypothetical protein
MAFADILAGFADAGHQHHTNLLRMDYEKKKDLSSQYGRLSEDPNYPEDVRAEALKRALTLHSLEPGKKIPKEIEGFSFTVQPRTPAPVQIPGSDGTDAQPIEIPGFDSTPQSATAQINPRTVQPPTPPPYQQTFAPMSYAQKLSREQQEARSKADVSVDTAGRTREAQNKADQAYPEPAKPVPPRYGVIGSNGVYNENTGQVTREPTPKEDIDNAHNTVTTEQGVFQWNPTTKLYDIRVGDRPRSAPAVQIGGLPAAVYSRAQTLASQFDSNPVVKQYNEAALRVANVDQILKSNWSGPGDMAVIFEFMRALDPTSVVRESEYATAAKTGNWFKGIYARFNGAFNPEGGFLSDQVKQDFQKVLQGRINAASKQVKGIYDDFGRRIDKMTGQVGTGAEYLTDYTKINPANAPTPPPSNNPLEFDGYVWPSVEALKQYKQRTNQQ